MEVTNVLFSTITELLTYRRCGLPTETGRRGRKKALLINQKLSAIITSPPLLKGLVKKLATGASGPASVNLRGPGGELEPLWMVVVMVPTE